MATSEFRNSSTSSSEFKGRYDIFLSFRGLDTRKKFTDHLYHALKCEGFHTFRDDDEIGRGDVIKPELQKAIANSKTSVIVLSKNYANSTACLLEVETILKQCKKFDHFVLPVFYEVDPGEIKEQAKNLDFGKKRVTVEQVKGWSTALKEVASMAGMVSQNQSNGYEADFIEKIVGELKSKLVVNHLRVGDHLVSMDSRTKRVTSWLKHRSTRVGILLICGMGGIGKTTIAKDVFNSNHARYDAACFLQNISEVAKGHNGLVRLQRQLLSDILRKVEGKVNDVDDGCRRMKYVLRNKRVLLVLDDVDQMDHLFALAGQCQQDWFSEGSKIIITTRLNSLMKNSDEIYDVYWPQKLSDDESLELFSWHAFRLKCPIQSHVALSKRFVKYCDGLPLALKVLGSSCREEIIDVWESNLHKLQADSDNSILGKLERSYDSLKDNHDKNLFLDIACFFVGKKKNETIKILEGCDYSALAGIFNLVNRNLLTIEKEKLQMHQLLQDMGKQIVCRESKYPEKCSRIWRSKESFNILLEKIGTKKIEGLVLDMNMLRNSNKDVFEANTFEKMYNLRLLKMTGVKVSGTYKAFPKRLRWLYWCGFPSESFPSDIPLENLVSLDIRHSNLKQVWKGTKVLGSLKILNLSYSPKFAKTPDFSGIPNLEKLILKACPSLFEVDESIVELQKIEFLNLKDCKNLRKLPRNIGMVESLVEIDISGCSNLMGVMEELGKMESLQVLKASRLMDINRVLTVKDVSQASNWPCVPKPRVQMSLASLPCSLVHLNLSNCNLTDDAFPRDLSNLSKLQHLFLCENPFSSLPNFIKGLTDLQTLDLSYCIKLQQIRWSSAILPHLRVINCDALQEITFETGTCIRDITPIFCWSLNHVQNSFKFLSVREVDVELLHSIGFFNLDSMADVEATVINCHSWLPFKLPIMIIYEHNVFSTHFPGREVPHWFSNKNSGSTISFTATLSPHFGFRGLTLCAVYTCAVGNESLHLPRLQFEINSKISGMKTVFRTFFYGFIEKLGCWLCHCFAENLLTEGDEVEVSFRNSEGQIKECGVHFLYFEEEGEVFQYVRHYTTFMESKFVSIYVPHLAELPEESVATKSSKKAGPSSSTSSKIKELEDVLEAAVTPQKSKRIKAADKVQSPGLKSILALSNPEEVINVGDEEEDEDLDLLFSSVNDMMKTATSGSGAGSSSQTQLNSEEIVEAKKVLKAALLMDIEAALHPGRVSNLQKAMEILVKSQALGTDKTILQYFYKDFPGMTKAYDSLTDDLVKVKERLTEIDSLNEELSRSGLEWHQLKAEITAVNDKKAATLKEIQELEVKLFQSNGRLGELEKESIGLENKKKQIASTSKDFKIKLSLLVEELPVLRDQKANRELQLGGFATSWENLRTSLVSLL